MVWYEFRSRINDTIPIVITSIIRGFVVVWEAAKQCFSTSNIVVPTLPHQGLTLTPNSVPVATTIFSLPERQLLSFVIKSA